MSSSKSTGKLRGVIFTAFLLAVVATSGALAQQRRVTNETVVSQEQLRAHVAYLASDELEGRRTGTRGADMAADYIAAAFKRYGLVPGANAKAAASSGRSATHGEFHKPFDYVAGVELGKGNAAVFTSRIAETSTQEAAPATLDLRVGEDWMPLGFSSGGRVENLPVVFAGYGISAAELSRDDYKGRNTAGRAALVFARTPGEDNPHGQFARYADLRLRAAAARAAGARALVLVVSEENFKDDKLSRLAFDNTGGDAGLPVVAVSRQAAARLLGLNGIVPLGELERGMQALSAKPHVAGNAAGEEVKANQIVNSLLSLSIDIVRREAPAANVVGILYGSDSVLKNEAVIIGAHYDHLGRGGRGSLAGREGEIHHGADDNASGTAAMLELARLFSLRREKLRRTIIFIAFSGEEEGLLGSNHYVNNPVLPLEQTVAMINMDMVGRLRERSLMVGGVGTASEWGRWIEEANTGLDMTVVAGRAGGAANGEGEAASGPNMNRDMTIVRGADGGAVAVATPVRPFKLRLSEDGYGPSDHASFYARRIPVLFLFTGTHEDYHKPSDTAERVNYAGQAEIVDFVRRIVEAVQQSDKRPTFTVAKAATARASATFRVYLGTIPNYAETQDGLKLEAVSAGSPAEKAGLRAGDRIVKIAGRDVRNVYDYTQALAEMKAGQEYEIEIVRDGNTLKLRITPAARK